MIEVGMEYVTEIEVTEADTARAIGSGTLAVLATPKMFALMEESAYKCVMSELEEGATTVGTSLNISHLSATPLGMKVKAVATVTGVDGRKISFDVKAYDEAGLIGEGTHERFIVLSERFIAKVYSKIK